MNQKQLYEFWSQKKNANNFNYKELLREQKGILDELNSRGVNPDLVEDYADYYFRGYDPRNKPTLEKLK